MGITPELTFASRPAGIDDGIYPFLVSIGFTSAELDAMICRKGVVTGITPDIRNPMMNKVVVDVDGEEYDEVPVYMHTDYGHARRVITGETATTPEQYTERAAFQFIADHRINELDYDIYNPVVMTLCTTDDTGSISEVICVIGIIQSLFTNQSNDRNHYTYTPVLEVSFGGRILNDRGNLERVGDATYVLYDLVSDSILLVPNEDYTELIQADSGKNILDYFSIEMIHKIKSVGGHISWIYEKNYTVNTGMWEGIEAGIPLCSDGSYGNNFGYQGGTLFNCSNVWTKSTNYGANDTSDIRTDNLWGGSRSLNSSWVTEMCGDAIHTSSRKADTSISITTPHTGGWQGVSGDPHGHILIDSELHGLDDQRTYTSDRPKLSSNLVNTWGSSENSSSHHKYKCASPYGTDYIDTTIGYSVDFTLEWNSGQFSLSRGSSTTVHVADDGETTYTGSRVTTSSQLLTVFRFASDYNFAFSGQFYGLFAYVGFVDAPPSMPWSYTGVGDTIGEPLQSMDSHSYVTETTVPAQIGQLLKDKISFYENSAESDDEVLVGMSPAVSISLMFVPFDLKAAHLY